MKTEKAQFLTEQLNPLLKKSGGYIRKLKVDPDNEQIELRNLFDATLHRVDYRGRHTLDVLHEIVENAL